MKLLTFLCAFCVSTALLAQSECLYGTPSHISIYHREWEGVGYPTGYSSLATFLTPNWTRDFQPFADFRGHIFNNGHFAANAGLGMRYALSDNTSLGANFYYDFRDLTQFNAHQIGPGVELLSEWLDFRANGYIPFTSSRFAFQPRFKEFKGNHAFFRHRAKVALPNIDAELGVPWRDAFAHVDLYFALGSYYLFRRTVDQIACGKAWGGKGRIEARVYDGVDLGVDFYYDRIFHFNPQGYVKFNFPLGPNTIRRTGQRWWKNYAHPICDRNAKVLARNTQNVDRFEIIPVQDRRDTRVLIDPRTGRPANFLFINPASLSSGTFEDPYHSIQQALANCVPHDILFLTPATYTGGFTLPRTVSLGSQSAEFVFNRRFVIPARLNGVTRIRNPGGTVFTAMGDNTIEGLHIQDGIAGIAMDTRARRVRLAGLTFKNLTSGIVASGGAFVSDPGFWWLFNNTRTSASTTPVFDQSVTSPISIDTGGQSPAELLILAFGNQRKVYAPTTGAKPKVSVTGASMLVASSDCEDVDLELAPIGDQRYAYNNCNFSSNGSISFTDGSTYNPANFTARFNECTFGENIAITNSATDGTLDIRNSQFNGNMAIDTTAQSTTNLDLILNVFSGDVAISADQATQNAVIFSNGMQSPFVGPGPAMNITVNDSTSKLLVYQNLFGRNTSFKLTGTNENSCVLLMNNRSFFGTPKSATVQGDANTRLNPSSSGETDPVTVIRELNPAFLLRSVKVSASNVTVTDDSCTFDGDFSRLSGLGNLFR